MGYTRELIENGVCNNCKHRLINHNNKGCLNCKCKFKREGLTEAKEEYGLTGDYRNTEKPFKEKIKELKVINVKDVNNEEPVIRDIKEIKVIDVKKVNRNETVNKVNNVKPINKINRKEKKINNVNKVKEGITRYKGRKYIGNNEEIGYGSNTEKERKTTIIIKRKTKERLQKWRENHTGKEKLSYDRIINKILNPDAFKDFEKWYLKGLDKAIIKYIEEGKTTNREIQKYIEFQGYELSLKSIQNHCVKLEKKGMIERINPGRRIKEWRVKYQ